MADENEVDDELQAKLYRRNTRRLRRNLLDRFLMAMKEDLAEWLTSLTGDHLNAISFMNKLDNGVFLCEHANLVQKYAEEYALKAGLKIPTKTVFYKERGAFKGSFIARDNVANFISWCRDLGIPDVVMFETEDLVLHKNEKTVVLTLLDVARKAAKFGVKPPQIVEFEEEIDREIEQDKKKFANNLKEKILQLEEENDLDQLVHEVVDTCTCQSKFPVKKLGDGKYKFGKCKTLIFVRVMRNHVMVRVGGGWDTLEHYIDKHDPCRMHVAGKIDRGGRREKFPVRKLSTTIEHSDENSVCSSESLESAEGYAPSSVSPDSEDFLSPQMSSSACSSHRSSMQHDSDDESVSILRSRSEPIKSQRNELLDNEEYNNTVRCSKSEAFTIFGPRKLSLMDDAIKDTDVYAARNPSDSWLRRQLNEVKQTPQAKQPPKASDENHNEVDEKENLTLEVIKKKYGKAIKSVKASGRGESSAVDTRVRRRTKTNPETVQVMNEITERKMKNDPQYSSWDQNDVAAKRRKDVLNGCPDTTGQASRRSDGRRDSSSGIPRLITPQSTSFQRPEFRKSYTLDLSKSQGIRRRGSDNRLNMSMKRETSLDSIVRKGGTRLPVPTARCSGRLVRGSSTGNVQKESKAAAAKSAAKNPATRLKVKTSGPTSKKL